MDATFEPLIDEVQRKAAVVWLTVADRPPYGVWCMGAEGALYLITGPGEQPAPDLIGATEVLVTARGDHGGRIVTWPAKVDRVWPRTDEWDTMAPQLANKRLNASGTAEATVERWASECSLIRLTPAGPPTAAGATLPDDSQAAPPVPTPAANRTKPPLRLHRVRRPPR